MDAKGINMNIHEMIEKMKLLVKEYGQFFKDTFEDRWKLYVGFVTVTSLVCIMAAEVFQSNGFRGWYYNWMNKEVISKAVEHPEVIKDNRFGAFITYYRYQEFGACNPESVDAGAPMVALTFDDGPNPDYTRRILEVLEENDSRATFFVVGTNAEKYQETLRMIASSGNEIGNHTYSHANLTNIDSEDVEEEIAKVNRAVKKATGEIATVIRPPYGAYDDDVLNQLQQPVVLWDLDTEDWDSRNAHTIVENIISNLDDGDIILMHDIYESTAEAVELLVPRLKEMGYQVVSVSEMAEYKGKELELHKAYGGVK